MENKKVLEKTDVDYSVLVASGDKMVYNHIFFLIMLLNAKSHFQIYDLFEAGLSTVVNIKTGERNRLHLSQGLRSALFVTKLCLSELFKQKQFEPTHREIRLSDGLKLHGLSPRANYTDRATAACR
jgi:hypothetical protein